MESNLAQTGNGFDLADRARVCRLASYSPYGTTNYSDCDASSLRRYQSGITRDVCATANGQRTAPGFRRGRVGRDDAAREGDRENTYAGNVSQRSISSRRLLDCCLGYGHVSRWRSYLRVWP